MLENIEWPANAFDLCSGKAAFTVLKDSSGLPILTPHEQNLAVYNLTVNTSASPTDEACTEA